MGQQETMVTGKNRIMVFGPKTDGTYVRRQDAGHQRAGWRDPRPQAFPGADALWALRAGCSVMCYGRP
jgi:hypothetical protein